MKNCDENQTEGKVAAFSTGIRMLVHFCVGAVWRCGNAVTVLSLMREFPSIVFAMSRGRFTMKNCDQNQMEGKVAVFSTGIRTRVHFVPVQFGDAVMPLFFWH